MKRLGETLASVISISLLTACGGVESDSKTNSSNAASANANAEFNTGQANTGTSPSANTHGQTDSTDAISTQSESMDNLQGETAEETVALDQGSSNDQPSTAAQELERAVTAAKAAMSIARQSLVSNDISTTNSLASFKTGQADATDQLSNSKRLNVTEFVSSMIPTSVIITENLTTTTLTGQCGGSAISDGSRSYDEEVGFPYVIQANVIFDEYCNDINTVYTGEDNLDLSGYTVAFNGVGSLTSEFPSEQEGHYEFDLAFTMTTDLAQFPPLVDIQQWVSCSYFDGISNFNPTLDCTTTLTYQDDDEAFTSGNYQVQGDNQSGYNVTVHYTDEDDINYQANFTDLTVCDNGNFGSGEGQLNYGNEAMGIVFQSCSQAVANYQGSQIQLTF